MQSTTPPKVQTPTPPSPSPTTTKTMYSTSGKTVPGDPVVYGGFTNVGGASTSPQNQVSTLTIVDKNTGKSYSTRLYSAR